MKNHVSAISNKIRIAKDESGFYIEIKNWFWGWIVIDEDQLMLNGIFTDISPRRKNFINIKEAEKYCNDHLLHKEKKIIVKYFF